MPSHQLKAGILSLAVVAALSPRAAAQGVSIANFHAVTEGKVYRSGKPAPDEIEQLKALGVKTVVSLESYMLDPDGEAEEERAVLDAGMAFVRVPMSPLPFEAPSVEQIQTAVDALKAPENQPALVHCYHGSDRTGLVVGAYHIQVDRWAADDAIDDMRNYGHGWMFYGWDELLYNF